jgi:(p)ppGpp synthase/HD superfamily hydrolase
MTAGTQLTERFEKALVYATQTHRGQRRKGEDTPYIGHLLAVTALVLEDGGNEDQAIAALLHDAVEDQGGLEQLAEIRNKFGEQVAEIVDGLSDAYGYPKPPWRQRKQRYLEHLRHEQRPAVLRVSLADKLHNARDTRRDLRQHGTQSWKRFKGGQQGSLWYYRSLVEIFKQRFDSPMVSEFEEVVKDLHSLSSSSNDRDRLK